MRCSWAWLRSLSPFCHVALATRVEHEGPTQGTIKFPWKARGPLPSDKWKLSITLHCRNTFPPERDEMTGRALLSRWLPSVSLLYPKAGMREAPPSSMASPLGGTGLTSAATVNVTHAPWNCAFTAAKLATPGWCPRDSALPQRAKQL